MTVLDAVTKLEWDGATLARNVGICVSHACGIIKRDRIASQEVMDKMQLVFANEGIFLDVADYRMEFPHRIPYREQREDDLAATLDYKDLCQKIKTVLKTLTTREQTVLNLRMDGETLEEVGKVFGATREHIRQIEGKAIRKLRHPSRMRLIDGFLDDKTEKTMNERYNVEVSL